MTTAIDVFLAIPEDLDEERRTACKLMQQDLKRDANLRDVDLIIHSWDFEQTGSDLVHHRFSVLDVKDDPLFRRPKDCDIFVMALWTQLGDPQPEGIEYETKDGRKLEVRYGTEWEFADARSRRNPHIFVYECVRDLGKTNAPGFEDRLANWQETRKFLKTVPSTYKVGFESVDKFVEILEIHLRQAIEALLNAPEDDADDDLAEPELEGEPFPGLEAFTFEQSRYFYGRSSEIKEHSAFFRGWEDHRFRIITGASGSGKSSLVWAGILPGLTECRSIGFHPGANPLAALAFAFAARPEVQLSPDLKKMIQNGVFSAEKLTEQLRTEGATGTTLAKLTKAMLHGAEQTRLLLYIDQLEELFTLQPPSDSVEPGKPDRIGEFLQVLLQALNVPDLGIVATLRADLYDEALQRSEIITLFGNTPPYLSPMTEGQLSIMLARQSQRAQMQFEDDALPVQIIRDANQSVALIAYTMAQLYEKCKDEKAFTWDAYNELGGVKGVIEQRANEVLNKPELVAHAKELHEAKQRLFSRLLTVNDELHLSRRSADFELFQGDPYAVELINGLTKARLITFDMNNSIKLAHEELFRIWDELAKFTEDHKNTYMLLEQVKFAAKQWKAARTAKNTIAGKRDVDKLHLWPHERLEPVAKMFKELDIEPGPTVKRFTRPESVHLLAEICKRRPEHRERARIGDRLSTIGDPRPGIGLTDKGLPNVMWCPVEGVEVNLTKRTVGWRYKSYTEAVDNFYMSQYATTFMQYQAFVSEVIQGIAEPLYEIDTTLSEQMWPFPNRPVDSVSWLDAIAFCNWLNEKRANDLLPTPPGLPDNYVFRLPTIGEWMVAAKVQDDPVRLFPWGKKWNATRANTFHSRISQTIAVGMYPEGDAIHPYGRISDIIGNLYEWCLNDSDLDYVAGAEKHIAVGNCWRCEDKELDTDRFDNVSTNDHKEYYGFRVVYARPLTLE